MTSYIDILRKLGRVRVEFEAGIPLSLRPAFRKRAAWLRDLLPRLDDELGVAYPLVLVDPAVLRAKLDDGNTTTLHAAVGPFATSWGVLWSVRLSAATLLGLSEELIEGLLGHEFKHYINSSLMHSGDFTIENYAENLEQYRRLDAQVAVPNTWLSPRLASLTARIDDPNDPWSAEWQLWAIDHWLPVGGLVRSIDLNFNVKGALRLDDAIVRRAAELTDGEEPRG